MHISQAEADIHCLSSLKFYLYCSSAVFPEQVVSFPCCFLHSFCLGSQTGCFSANIVPRRATTTIPHYSLYSLPGLGSE